MVSEHRGLGLDADFWLCLCWTGVLFLIFCFLSGLLAEWLVVKQMVEFGAGPMVEQGFSA